ncbi:unnamed protein product, partial [Iphiclides podalirius]
MSGDAEPAVQSGSWHTKGHSSSTECSLFVATPRISRAHSRWSERPRRPTFDLTPALEAKALVLGWYSEAKWGALEATRASLPPQAGIALR